MGQLQINGWKNDYVGFTGWDAHAKAEFGRRLRQAISASPQQLQQLNRAVRSRLPFVISNVREESLRGLCQMLETMGADVNVVLGES